MVDQWLSGSLKERDEVWGFRICSEVFPPLFYGAFQMRRGNDNFPGRQFEKEIQIPLDLKGFKNLIHKIFYECHAKFAGAIPFCVSAAPFYSRTCEHR